MLRVALTGTMGAGKSTVGAMLAAYGAPVIDTDGVARQVTEPGTPGYHAITAHFGPAVTGTDGQLDRRALASIVFAQPGELAVLEAITHPLVAEAVAVALEDLADQPLVVVQVPLLDDHRRRQYGIERVVLVEASPELTMARAVERGFPAEDVAARRRAQPGDDQRRALADWVITNEGDLEELRSAVDRLWAWLTAGAPRPQRA